MERIPNQERGENKRELFRRGIELYLKLLEKSGIKMTDEIDRKAQVDSAQLDSGGLRYGAPNYGHLKFQMSYGPKFDENDSGTYFQLFGNGMDKEEFKKWDEFVGIEFEREGFLYRYRSRELK